MDIVDRLSAVVRERRLYEASKKPVHYNSTTTDWINEAAAEITKLRKLRGALLVAHGALMKSTGGDEYGEYEKAVTTIRNALGCR